MHKRSMRLRAFFLSVFSVATSFAFAQNQYDSDANSRTAEEGRAQAGRTLENLRYGSHFQVYTALEKGHAVDLEKINSERSRSVLARDARYHEGQIYEIQPVEELGGWVWRRARPENYIAKFPTWEVLTRFAQPVGNTAVISPSFVCLAQRCMVRVPRQDSRGGLWREFDLKRKDFVNDGFKLENDRVSEMIWLDDDTILVRHNADANAGEPETYMRWSRGSPFSSAKEVLHARSAVERFLIRRFENGDQEPFFVVRSRIPDPVEEEKRTLWRLSIDGALTQLPFPEDAEIIGTYQRHTIVRLDSSAWDVGGRKFPAQSLLSVPTSEVTAANPAVTLVAPAYPGQAIHLGDAITKDCVLSQTFEFMHQRFRCHRLERGKWRTSKIHFKLPIEYTSSFDVNSMLSSPSASIVLAYYQDFIRPKTMMAVDTRRDRVINVPWRAHLPFEKNPPYAVKRFDARSRDGTLVPYVVAHPKNLKLDGAYPTIIWFFGAWGVPEFPLYNRDSHYSHWLQQGGVYVIANVRGGSEMGPEWYVRKLERRHVYEDLIAVAEDLIRRKFTSPKHLGLHGHYRYGGLATEVVSRMRPDLFNAAVIEDSFLDLSDPALGDEDEMGSWTIPQERAYLESISPLQNLQNRGRQWPPLILLTRNNGRGIQAQAVAKAAQAYIRKAEALQIPYLFYDGQYDASLGVSYRTIMYGYLAQRLMPQGEGGD